MRKPFLLAFLIVLSVSLGACGSKSFKFTGEETDEEALNKCLKLSEKKHYKEAVECLEIFKSRFPESDYASEAELRIGDAYFRKKDWLLAAESYALYARLHPTSDKLDYAYYRAGLAFKKLLPRGVDRSMNSVEDAQNNFATVFRRFPESPYAQEAQKEYDIVRGLSAKKSMYIGKFYYKYGQYRAAIPRFLEILQDYPNLGFDEEAFYRLGISYLKLGMKDKAQGAAQLMQEKFPNSKKTKKLLAKTSGGSHG